MLTRNLADMVPSFVSKRSQLSYLNELRSEVFSQEPLRSLVKVMLITVPEEILFDKKNFPLVNASYDWTAIRESTDQILTSCNEMLPYSMTDCLVQTWSVLPVYLKRYRKFYTDVHETDNPQVTFMHNLLTEPLDGATSDQIQRSRKLPSDQFLSLETGIITKASPKYPYEFNRLMSKSQTKIRAAVNLLNRTIWNEFDIDVIVKNVRDKNGTRYYNISTDSMINSRTVKRMANVNHDYQVVAGTVETHLFDHIVQLLTHEKLLTPPSDVLTELIASTTIPKKASSSSKSQRRFIQCGEVEYEIVSSDSDIDVRVEQSSDDDLEKQSPPQKRTTQKRRAIPAKIRQLTWRKYIGRSMDGNCWCCNDEISFENWHAGHVLAHVHGGKDTVENLRPLCACCNLSMHDTHMADFIRDHEMKGRGAKEFKRIFPSQLNSSDDDEVDDLMEAMSSLGV